MQDLPRPIARVLLIGFVLGLLSTPFVGAPASGFGERVFDSNTVIGPDPFFLVYTAQRVAQSFTATDAYRLQNVTLRMRNDGPTGDRINITIQTDAAGIPSGVLLAWSNPITGGTVGSMNAPLTPNPLLAKGTVYWIVATKGGAMNDAYEWYHSGGAVYPEGKAMLNPGAGWTDPGSPTDLWFLTYGQGKEGNLTIAMTAAPARVLPKDFVNLTIYANNTGSDLIPATWLNVTLPEGLTYVSDTANLVPSSTAFPNFTFASLGNGPHSFQVTARVDIGVSPATTLTSTAVGVFANATGFIQSPRSASSSVIVGLQSKQLYLIPANPAPPQGLTPVPPSGTQVVYQVRRGGAAFDFQLTAPLAGPFRMLNVSALLYLDSNSHNVRNLDMNLTLLDADGVTQSAVTYFQQRSTTDNVNGFQLFSYPLPSFDHTFPAGHWILFRVRAMGSGSDDALLATNATATRSHLEILTPTYVRIDTMELRDASAPAAVWSPRDRLVVRVNVSDPFGTGEIQGVWLNVTDPSGNAVVVLDPMVPIASDPGNPSAWRIFDAGYGPALNNGTYRLEVLATEKNGAKAFALASAMVRLPVMGLDMVPSQTSALSGDIYFYELWYNNSGTGPAGRVWINLSLPVEVAFVTSSDEGNRTGPANWTFGAVPPGSPLLFVEVQARPGVSPAPFIRASAALNYSDEKSFAWAGQTSYADVVLRGPIIALSITSAVPTIHPNETFGIVLGLVNTGDLAGELWLNVTMSPALAYMSDDATSVGGTSVATGSGVAIRLFSLAGGDSWTLHVTVRSRSGLARGTTHAMAAALNYTNSRAALMPPEAVASNVSVIAPAFVDVAVRLLSPLAVPGDIVSSIFNFTNAGDELAQYVWANLSLDSHLSLASASMAVSVSGTNVRFALSNVPLGGTYIFLNFTVSAAAADASVLVVSGSISYTDRVGNRLPSLPAAPTNVTTTAPILEIRGFPGDALAEPGNTVTFSMVPSNLGTAAAGDVWINVTLPSDLVYVADTSDGGRTVSGPDIGWHWNSFGRGARPYDLLLLVRTEASDQSTAAVTFRLESTDTNGNRREDVTAVVRVRVIAPRIILTLAVSQDRVTAGTAFHYTLRVQNNGTTMTQTLYLLDSLNSRLSLDSYTSNVPASGTTDLNWTYRLLQPGEQQVITLFVRVPDGTPIGTVISNSIAAVYSNSNGTIVGYAQSETVFVTIVEGLPVLPIAAVTAAAAAVPIGFVVHRKRQSRIEEVFLVTKDGILIHHLTRNLVDDVDPDIVSGMLAGVQQFARDAFRYGEDRSLHQMQFGDHRVLIERGDMVFLAGVCTHGNDALIGRKLRKVIEEIEARYREVLRRWDGDMDLVAGARDLIRKSLLE